MSYLINEDDFSSGFTTQNESRYLTISHGKLREKVEEGTKGAKTRKNKLGDTVHELEYDQFTGKSIEISWREGEYGNSYWPVLKGVKENVTLMLNQGSSANSFLMKLCGCDLSKNIRITPFFIEKIGEPTRAPIKVEQMVNGKPTPIQPLYNKENRHPKAPVIKVPYEKMSKGQQMDYWSQVDKFMVEVIIPELNEKIRKDNEGDDDFLSDSPKAPVNPANEASEEGVAEKAAEPEDDLPF